LGGQSAIRKRGIEGLAWRESLLRPKGHAAHAILTRAASLHPTDPTIQFNLACYEAQMGGLNRAKAHLKRATEPDPKFRLMALEDPDLEPVWASLATDRA
jgi:hypothetical protein